jgi:polysaccharide export outer membrane protein
MLTKFIAVLAIVGALPATLHGQTQKSSPPPATQKPPAAQAPHKPDFVIPKPEVPGSTSPPQAPVNLRAYKIGLQDQLKITVFDEPEMSTTYRVDADGFVTFPLIGRVAASGSTIAELEQRVTSMLSSGYLRNPQVRIEIDQYKSQSVYVIGEVRSPGKITMTGNSMTLLEALALAGSPTANASNEVIVVHPSRPSTATPTPADANAEGTRLTVNRKDLELGKVGQDIVLQDGDIINVPVAQRFYISGYVRNPGFYVLDPGMTIAQAIALAGGLNERGSDRRITATRMVSGKSTEVKVEPEDSVQPNDTINIAARFF